MTRLTNDFVNPEFLKIEYQGHLAILTFQEGGFKFIDDLNTGGQIFKLLDSLEKDPAIFAIMIFNGEQSLNREQYKSFIERASGKDLSSEASEKVTGYDNPAVRTREVIFLQRLILRIMSLEKLVVRCITKEIATPMVGLSLACDLRFMSANSRFVFPHVDFGVHPAGGLPFFLQKYLGHGKSLEVLLRGNDITAHEAQQLNLVNNVFPEVNFRESCIDNIGGLCSDCTLSIKKTKRIMRVTVEELKHYFDEEAKQLA
jgi:enoyl-CoA hydratase/carnithine racemase